MDNICRFVRTESFADISILNFVYEKRSELSQSFITPAAYSLNAVTSGSARSREDRSFMTVNRSAIGGSAIFTIPPRRASILPR